MRVILLLIMATLSGQAGAADALKEILLDNEKVQVVRLTYPPGTESGMHSHVFPHRVVYVLQGGQLQLTPDGSGPAQMLDVASGTTLYLPAQTHNVKNIGATTVMLMETELKL
jgi:quercetin dioxygenase-like cupin family protein